MKWFVGAFLVLNLGLIGLIDYLQPHRVAPFSSGQGRLPRVSDLRVNQAPLANGDQRPLSRRSDAKRYCGRITGFDSLRKAKKFIGDNEAFFDSATVETTAPAEKPQFGLIVPPRKGHEQALALLKRFQRAGIDSYLVTEGRYQYAISLGLFDSRHDAQEARTHFQDQGIDSVLVSMPREEPRYALFFKAHGRPDRSAIASQLKHYGHRLEMVNFQSCQGVATSDKSP